MSSAAERPLIPFSEVEQLREARAIVRMEADALHGLAQRLDASFCAALQLLHDCSGHVVVTGMGKAGLIGQKIAATLSSTGTRALFLHPAEAVHGDLGCLHPHDVVLALSNSGETEELRRLLPLLQRMEIPIVAITASDRSTLGSAASITLRLGRLQEAGPYGLAPSTTTTAMLAVGDALALVLSRMKGFTPQLFAQFHPGGSLGEKLRRVDQVMRKADELRIAQDHQTVRQVLQRVNRPGRRTGAVMLVNEHGQLTGLFTDSDLVRLLEQHRESQLDRPISEVMTSDPLTVAPDALLHDVLSLLSRHKFSEVPVIDASRRPVGLIDITDLIGLVPTAEAG